jgi:hypothetical protein
MDNGKAFTVFCDTIFINAVNVDAHTLQACVDLCAVTEACAALDWFDGSGNCYFYEGAAGTETSGSTISSLGLIKAGFCG